MNREEVIHNLFDQGKPVEFMWLSKEKLADIMEEYAKQQAVGFAELTIGWEVQISANRDFQWKSKFPSIYGERLRTTAELYAEFIKDQTPKSL